MRRPSALRGAAAVLAAVFVSGCSSWVQGESVFGILTPYRIDIQQGNVVTQDQLARVKPGMNRLQVRDALGTPLVTDAFHTERWDYVFTLNQRGRPAQRRHVVLVFEGDVLKSIDAPDLPTETEFVNSISRGGRTVSASALELTPEQIQALPAPRPLPPSTGAAPEAAPPLAPRNYPPLEPS